MRRNLSPKARLSIFLASGGICHLCGRKIEPGEGWELEHVIPLAMGGEDAPANMQPAHAKCHKAKTRDDVGNIARAKRREARHLGAYRPKRLIPGSKGTGLRKHIDGRVSRRQED